jgi:vitamin B12/bleomycin/antimicrobial peptide transport system ATP-binding/permease protein
MDATMAAKDSSHPTQAPFPRRFLNLAGGYWQSRDKWRIWLELACLIGLTVGQVLVPIAVNLWSKQLFDAMEQRSMDRFLHMILLAGAILAVTVVVTYAHLRIKRRLQLDWRQWLTQKVVDAWVFRGRHYQVNYLDGDHDNPDGRIAEDIRITAEYAIDLGHSLLYCLLLLLSFVNILWMLSGAITLRLGGLAEIAIPGYLLYVALIYAAAGTTVALMVGSPLVNAVNRRQRLEADFRYGLARVRENAQAIALLHGEADERGRISRLFDGVKRGWHGQTTALANVMMFSSGYSVLSAAFPILVSAPRYIAGTISLGVLMQTTQAFQQTAAALSWPIDNLSRVAEWRASVDRVLGLYQSLLRLDESIAERGGARILVERTDSQRTLTFQGVGIDEPDGRPVLQDLDAEILPGQRVLIAGDTGAAIRLFRAVARVWPWGRGRIGLPAHTRVFFMPQRPYMPTGTLLAALIYPGEAENADRDQVRQALERVGMGHLQGQLLESESWEEILSLAELQRLGFARLLLRQPDWIFIEDATDALGTKGEDDMLTLLDREFRAATLLTIGSHDSLEAHHTRKLVLERGQQGIRMREEPCRPLCNGAICEPEL